MLVCDRIKFNFYRGFRSGNKSINSDDVVITRMIIHCMLVCHPSKVGCSRTHRSGDRIQNFFGDAFISKGHWSLAKHGGSKEEKSKSLKPHIS